MKRPKLLTPWQHALALIGDKEALYNLCMVSAHEEIGFVAESATIACDSLRETWTGRYLPHETHVALIAALVDRARRSADKRFPDEDFYVRARYSRQIPLPDEQVWCVTGLAGISKSATMAAVARVFKKITPVSPFPTVAGVDPAFVLHLKLRSMRSVGQILESIANPLFLAGRTKVSQIALRDHLREWLYAKSTLLMLVDELQFVSTSQNASTLIMNTISALAELGPPVVYICNYSLAHKLMRRNHEEKDRFLSRVIVMHPPAETDPHWACVVESYLSAAKLCFDFTAEQAAPELHRLTGGMYRALKDLLCEACSHAWQGNTKNKVTMNNVRNAYRSDGYTSHRADIESLTRIPTSAQVRSSRPDLVSPFSNAIEGTIATAGPTKIQPKPAELSPVVKDTFESAISAAGRKVLKELRDASLTAPPERNGGANIKSIRKRAPVTGASLLANLNLIGYGTSSPLDDDTDK